MAPKLHAVSTDVHIWKSEELRSLDLHLQAVGVNMHSLCWENYELLHDDTDHFTWNGFTAFAKDLVKLVRSLRGRTLVVSDSTIDYWNWGGDGTRTNDATRLLESACPNMRVDAVCGSGFVATRKDMTDFRTRLRGHRMHQFDHVLLVGGWNDLGCSKEQLYHALRQMSAPIR